MPSRKAIIATGLVLALAALIPASGAAKAGGSDRPSKATVTSGTARFNLVTNAFTVDFAGVGTHTGMYTAHGEGTGVVDATGILHGSGTTTIVAANGDEIFGTFTVTTADFPPDLHTATSVTTITGGTGRFADATGTLTTFVFSTNFTVDFPIVTRTDDTGTTMGTISY